MSGDAQRVLIVGAGISGLAAGLALEAQGRDYLVLEARDRVGGRALSRPVGDQDQVLDLGPAWIWPESQPHLMALLRRFGLEHAPQFEDGLFRFDDIGGARSMRFMKRYGDAARIVGGIEGLARAMAAALDPTKLRLSAPVTAVDLEDGVSARLASGEVVTGAGLVLAIPPRLGLELDWAPVLPADLAAAMAAMPTWMAAHAKALAVYARPFWRDAGLSGSAASRVGPLMEINDHSAPDESFHALFGFVGLPAVERRRLGRDLERAVLEQLERVFGPDAAKPSDFSIFDWSDEPYTCGPGDEDFPPGHPPYGHRTFEVSYFDGRVAVAGAETSVASGGLIEGAVFAGERAVRLLG